MSPRAGTSLPSARRLREALEGPSRRDNPRPKTARPSFRLPPFLASDRAAAAYAIGLSYLPDEEYEPEGFVRESREVHQRARDFRAFARSLCVSETFEVCRAIAIPRDLPWREAVSVRCLGKSWSAKACGAGVYGSVDHRGPTRRVQLVGHVQPEDVEWEESFQAFLAYAYLEWEVRLRDEAPVSLIEIDGEWLSPPIEGNAGTHGEEWRDGCAGSPSYAQDLSGPPRRANPRAASDPYEYVRGGLPWSEDRLLVFHTLTTLGFWPENKGRLEALVKEGVVLMPADRRPGARGRLLDKDAAAGDGRYLFFSLGRPYRGDDSREPPWLHPHGEVTVAFDYDRLAARAPFAWRPQDQLWLYGVLPKRVARRLAPAADPARGPDVLRAAADLATIRRPAVVRALATLYLRFLRADADPRAQRRIAREAEAVWRPFAEAAEERRRRDPRLRDVKATDLHWEAPFRVHSRAAWVRHSGSPRPVWPDSLDFSFGPELLYEGEAPLSEAAFFFDPGTQRWWPMHQLGREQLRLPGIDPERF